MCEERGRPNGKQRPQPRERGRSHAAEWMPPPQRGRGGRKPRLCWRQRDSFHAAGSVREASWVCGRSGYMRGGPACLLRQGGLGEGQTSGTIVKRLLSGR